MAEAIPIAPNDNSSSKENGSKKDQMSSFDEEILSEIENRLDLENGDESFTGRAGEKVELDKADLPIDLEPSPLEEQPTPEIEVDLAGEQDLLVDSDKPDEKKTSKKSKGLKKLILIFASLFLVALAGLGYWYGFIRSDEPMPEVKQEPAKPYLARGVVPDPKVVLRVRLEPFLVPLVKPEKGGRILQVSVSLEVGDQSLKKNLEDKRKFLRDIIYRVLRDRPVGEIKKARAKKLLQAQIKAEVNHLFKRNIVYEVFFTDFVITG